MQIWKRVLQTLVALAALALAWSVFSRLAAGNSADNETTLWAGAIFVAVIAGIAVISLLFSWLQHRTSRAAVPSTQEQRKTERKVSDDSKKGR